MARRAAGRAAAPGSPRPWDTCGTSSPPRPPPSAACGGQGTARRCPAPRCSSSSSSSPPPSLLAKVSIIPLAIPSCAARCPHYLGAGCPQPARLAGCMARMRWREQLLGTASGIGLGGFFPSPGRTTLSWQNSPAAWGMGFCKRDLSIIYSDFNKVRNNVHHKITGQIRTLWQSVQPVAIFIR